MATFDSSSRSWTKRIRKSRTLAEYMLGTRYSTTHTLGLWHLSRNTSRTSCNSRCNNLSSRTSYTRKSKTSCRRYAVKESRVAYRRYSLIDRRRDAATVWRDTRHKRLKHTKRRLYIDRSSHSYARRHSTKWYTLWLSHYDSHAATLRMSRESLKLHKSSHSVHTRRTR